MVLGKQIRAVIGSGGADAKYFHLIPAERAAQFIKFCIVGGSGVLVDMAVLYLLADPSRLGLNTTLSKICAAEAAITNNFTWNELWTFRRRSLAAPKMDPTSRAHVGVFRRFIIFNCICGIGIALAVLLLHVFYSGLRWNLYLSNLLAIISVTLWNFSMNAQYNWSSLKMRM